MELGVLLCASLGLRRGEAVGLSWGDIDFENKLVHIQHSYDNDGHLLPPKTKAGNRFLPLTDTLATAFKRRRDIQIITFRNYAPDLLSLDANGKESLSPSAPVISDDLGNRIHPAGLGHWWCNHRSNYGLDGWTLHELRHSFLSLATQKGVHPSVMQRLAGHSTSRVTMEIYTHVNIEAQREAMDSLEDVLGPITA